MSEVRFGTALAITIIAVGCGGKSTSTLPHQPAEVTSPDESRSASIERPSEPQAESRASDLRAEALDGDDSGDQDDAAVGAGGAATGGAATGGKTGGSAGEGEPGDPAGGVGGSNGAGEGGAGGAYECDETPVAPQPPHRLHAGYEFTLLHRLDGTVVKWGAPYNAEFAPEYPGVRRLEGVFSSVVTGFSNACGLRANGAPECTFFSTTGVNESLLPGPFFQLAIDGSGFGCGLGTDWTVRCWGYIEPPPNGAFTRIAAADDHACGIRPNGSVECWFVDNPGWSRPVANPCGTFSEVAVAYWHTCGIQADGEVRCWGREYYRTGVLHPPGGTFVHVATSAGHGCAVRTNGTVACWGGNAVGQATPPAGTFIDVAVGGEHSCALRANGTVACWGSDHVGQATPPSELRE